MKPLRIALVGKKATDKTFVAFYLRTKYRFKQTKLMDGVDGIIKSMYGWEKYKRPVWEQRLAIYDALYKVDPEIHLKHLFNRLEKIHINHVVVEDVRYLNEVETLAKSDFIIIRVTMALVTKKKRIVGLKNAASGTLILNEHFGTENTRPYKADYTITGTTREGVRKSVDQIIENLLANT